MSEIATRAGKDSSTISEPLSKLRELGYVSREVPFGESPKKSKKGIYHINDSLLRFHYQFIVPYRSILELGRMDMVMQVVLAQLPQFIGQCWELLRPVWLKLRNRKGRSSWELLGFQPVAIIQF